MRAILIISTVLVLVNARPDLSQGYQYDTPQVNYQGTVPEQTNAYGSTGETLPNFVPVQTHSGPALPPVYPDVQQPDNFIPTGPSDVQLQGVPQFAQTAPDQQTNVGSQALTTESESYRSLDAPQQSQLSTSYDATPSGIPQQQQSFGGNSQQVQSSFGGIYQQQPQSLFTSNSQQQGFTSQNTFSSSFAQNNQDEELPPIITKHFYVHAAPEEPEESQGPRFVNIGRKQKNYKIIFIKAPTYGFNSQVIPIIQPNEEKTIVYVLSKKPSFNQDISLPPVPVTEPTKPEVFFIKYKTDSEAQEAQQKIQGEYETSNLGASNDEVIGNDGIEKLGLSSGNVASQSCLGGSSCSSASTSTVQLQTVKDEQQPYNSAISTNLVEAPQVNQPVQQLQQQNDEHSVYLPPNQH